MRDIEDADVRAIKKAVLNCLTYNPINVHATVQSSFGEIRGWNFSIDSGDIVYDLESGGAVRIRIQVETEGV